MSYRKLGRDNKHRKSMLANLTRTVIKNNKVFLIIFMLVAIMQIYFIYYGGIIFRTYGLNLKELLIVLGLAFSVVPVDLFRKFIFNNNKDYI